MEVSSYASGLIDSRMHIVTEGRRALVIDPCISDSAFAMLEAGSIQDVRVILTHEHYDHISGVNEFKSRYACSVLCSRRCGENIRDTVKNASKYFMIAMMNQNAAPKRYDYVCSATDVFQGEMSFHWMGHSCFLKETPGHSPGSCCIIIDGRLLFSGDTLIKDQEIITRLPGGDAAAYQTVTRPFLEGLPPDCLVYPGHGEPGVLNGLLPAMALT